MWAHISFFFSFSRGMMGKFSIGIRWEKQHCRARSKIIIPEGKGKSIYLGLGNLHTSSTSSDVCVAAKTWTKVTRVMQPIYRVLNAPTGPGDVRE
ncbi:hypothetical protein SERLA73DRAFT_178628 [Serpula lacrymans var. lacrymans S7.3]|uniref:Uncharacterized protein n=1 Tax=Serpula lacrymans var. lacrymans (strain S7.3) TaxID=936435 RepID=F8PSA9_SERL3|nr:hypothetical protein SERLA73DRAFT_178628 [Serpula lacrymans var. lacrymans S7.3]